MVNVQESKLTLLNGRPQCNHGVQEEKKKLITQVTTMLKHGVK
jgi:hypothetical protein